MTRFVHKIYLSFYIAVVMAAIIIIGYIGFSFYKLPVEDRYFHPDYALLKPSGFLGHGLGIIGSLLIVIGVFSYMARKRIKMLSGIGTLKYWLEFHIFLCALGPVFILYHTSFKFGGIVAISFWSLVAVVASGVIGRFIYLQIPRTIEGRELSFNEVQDMKDELAEEIKFKYNIEIYDLNKENSGGINSALKANNLSKKEVQKVKDLIRTQQNLVKKIKRLDMMQNIFKYWHVAHLPFALIMLIVMVIHVIVVLTLGYKWIF
ncbi:MAG: hypothetical protein WCL21_00945 [Mariniphaga sp.]